ncbi:MAG: hypothetical protein M3R67_12610 [Acidobacteriota bacterium]|nr:hypothetical protein [Acidobacteriota bacterium]
MKNKNIMVWGFLFAGVLALIAGLRDLFAPGFFSMSPRLPTNTDIIGQFVAAVALFAVAALSRSQNLSHANKK